MKTKTSPAELMSWLEPERIEIGVFQNPRSHKNPGFSAERMQELLASIAKDGMFNPLLVWDTDDKLVLIAGERRLRTVLKLKETNEKCRNPLTKQEQPAVELFRQVQCRVVHCDELEATRLAISENKLHEKLSDFEMLLQVKRLEQKGYSRIQQAEVCTASEAWISQSHSLLEADPKLLAYMEQGLLNRTAAITFIPIQKSQPDKVGIILDIAMRLTFEEAEKKEQLARQEHEKALENLENAESVLAVEGFTGGVKERERAREQFQQASRSARETRKKLERVGHKKNSLTIRGETIVEASRRVFGSSGALRRAISGKRIGQLLNEMAEHLKVQESYIAYNGHRLCRQQVQQQYELLDWIAGNRNQVQHPFELLAASPLTTSLAGCLMA